MKSIPKAEDMIEQAEQANEKKATSIFGTCVSDDFGKPIPPTQWLFEKLKLAQGLTIIGAQSYAGKTITCLDLAIAAATGKDALGGYAMGGGEPKRVLYLDYEQQPDMLRQRIERLAHHRKLDLAALKDQLRAYSFPKLYLGAHTTEDSLKEHFRGFDVVFIDTLRAAMPGVAENDSGEVRGVLDPLCRAATGRTIIATHHAGKLSKDQKNDMRAYFRGSTGFIDACDSAYVLKEIVSRKTGMRVQKMAELMHLKNRHIGGVTIDPILLSFEDTDSQKGLAIVPKEWGELERRTYSTDSDQEEEKGTSSAPSKVSKTKASSNPNPYVKKK